MPPAVLLWAGSGNGIASLFVKYGPSSALFPAAWTPVNLAAVFAGPSLAPWNNEESCIGRGSAPAAPTASPIA
jgi:hypothetical protein